MHARITRDERDGVVTVKIEGNFDRSAAEQLRASLDALGEGPVVLDFSRVDVFPDWAIEVLARGLKAQSLMVRGLDTHHERLFRCFGISASRSAVAGDFEEARSA